MSLQYIIDGYNIVNHPSFSRIHKKAKDPRTALLEVIRHYHLRGSSRNKTILVFDGYPPVSLLLPKEDNIEVIFSRDDTADKRIKAMLDSLSQPKNTVVVSDDKEIKFFARSTGAISLSVQDFMLPAAAFEDKSNGDLLKSELSFTQKEKINKELKQIWLK